MYEWEMHANSQCQVKVIEGSHFFAFENIVEVTGIINSTLAKYY